MRSMGVALAAVALMADCGGNPISIKDCHDQYGRGSTAFNALKVSCAASGPDVKCQAIADNSASLYVYCPTSEDVTTKAAWSADDSSIAVLDPAHPGVFRTVGDGVVSITAEYQRLPVVIRARDFLLSPGMTAQSMSVLTVAVFGPDQARLSGVQIVLELARGPVQTCVTQSGGCPSRSLRLVSGAMTVRATKDGFQPWVMTLQADTSKGDVSQRIDLVAVAP